MGRETLGRGSLRVGARLLGVLLAALLLVGCGDGEPASFEEGYDEAIERYAEEVQPIIDGGLGVLLDPGGMAGVYDDLRVATDALFEDVEALEPPPERAEAHEAMRLNLVSQSRVLEDAAGAERAGDDEASLEAIEAWSGLQDEFRALDDELSG